ncbi:hypothetical protein M2444_006779 [Paenibacillus sp. PastF-3]|uniref:hypothetical protein n=1 Tax=Paenibacillus sp. PastF-3 TaxID=2940626 RepID=UPI002474B6B8|nr:hypothetical protein [Paenibacillus sp. PastF-3]MDH6374915.1 hypothetical protein [Paenibacillus sp. PastF-3]
MKLKHFLSFMILILIFGTSIFLDQIKAEEGTKIEKNPKTELSFSQLITDEITSVYSNKGNPMRKGFSTKPNGEIKNVEILYQSENDLMTHLIYRFSFNDKLMYGLIEFKEDRSVSDNTTLWNNDEEDVQLMTFHISNSNVIGIWDNSDSFKKIILTYKDNSTETIDMDKKYLIYYPSQNVSNLSSWRAVN